MREKSVKIWAYSVILHYQAIINMIDENVCLLTEILVAYNLMSPEDISENVGKPHQAPLLEFVNFITLVSPN